MNAKSGEVIIRVDPRYFRPAEVEYAILHTHILIHYIRLYSLLLGSPAKAERMLGWKRIVDFDSLVKEMVQADLIAAQHLIDDQN